VAKIGTSNSDRTISLRLQCVVKKDNITPGKKWLEHKDHLVPRFSIRGAITPVRTMPS